MKLTEVQERELNSWLNEHIHADVRELFDTFKELDK